MRKRKNNPDKKFRIALARAFGGAIIFSLPLLMTMEMWWFGFYMDRGRLALFLLLSIPLLMGLSYKVGFKDDFSVLENIFDAFTAYAIGFFASSIILYIFSILKPGMSFDEILGKITLQAVPASIGALLARTQLGVEKVNDNEKKKSIQYGWEIFLMGVGALFLAFNLVPTEEIILIAFKLNEFNVLAIIFISIAIMHAFVYKIEFHGQEEIPEGKTMFSIFARFTIVGYALVLLMSLYVLWTFGRTDGLALKEIMISVVILGFPGAVGAAAARLII